MSLSKENKNIAYPLIAGLSIVALIFIHLQNRELQKETAQLNLQKAELQKETELFRRLLHVDTLLLDNQYEEASALVKDLGKTVEDPDLAMLFSGRQEAIEHLQENWIHAQPRPVLPTFATLEQSPEQPVTVLEGDMNKDSMMALQNQLDSMAFALQKAEIFADKLQVQVNENTAGNYMSFKSQRGNMIYYVGDIREGKAHGSGVGLLSTGSRYQGEWQNNLKHGKGIFEWQDGAHYDGEYRDDLRHGTGTYYWPDGQKFIGEWEKDVRSGEGTFYDAKGKKVAAGLWRDDELVKPRKE